MNPVSCPERNTLDRNVLREAYAVHFGELHRFAMRSLSDRGLAEEVVQEAFARAWKSADAFNPDIASLRTWLFAILRNVIIDLARTRAAHPTVTQAEVEVAIEPTETDLIGWQVEVGIRRLSDKHRRVLVETYYRDRPLDDVARSLGVPVGTVKSRLHYALKALRVELEQLGFEG
jgi:RNA polymerase sigma-70 factor, ECF subfamily